MQQQTLQITDWRVQAGLATSLVAEQARAAAEQTAAQVPQLQASLAQARHALAVLTGQAPAALDAALAAPQAVPQPSQALALDIPADTLRQRPDVRVAQERVQAALARVSQADAARYPSLRLSGSLGLRALTLGAMGDSASLVHSLLGSVAGLLVSYHADLPSGPAIVLGMAVLMLASMLAGPFGLVRSRLQPRHHLKG